MTTEKERTRRYRNAYRRRLLGAGSLVELYRCDRLWDRKIKTLSCDEMVGDVPYVKIIEIEGDRDQISSAWIKRVVKFVAPKENYEC